MDFSVLLVLIIGVAVPLVLASNETNVEQSTPASINAPVQKVFLIFSINF